MKRSKKTDYEGGWYHHWEVEKDDRLTSRDFSKDAKDFELKAVVVYNFEKEDRLVVYGEDLDHSLYRFALQPGTILVVKEKQL